MLERMSDNITAVTLSPWGAEEVGLYLEGQKLESDAARIADIASGRPGFIAELVTYLKNSDQLGADLSGMTMANLADLSVDGAS